MKSAAKQPPCRFECDEVGRRSTIASGAVLMAIMFGLTCIVIADDVAKKSTEQPPLVYAVEHTGAALPAPVLPGLDDLPETKPLTDPFMWSDGSGRVTKFDEWSRRRAEIKAEIEHYEIGKKPSRPEKITANYDNGKLTINVTVSGETLTLTSPSVRTTTSITRAGSAGGVKESRRSRSVT